MYKMKFVTTFVLTAIASGAVLAEYSFHEYRSESEEYTDYVYNYNYHDDIEVIPKVKISDMPRFLSCLIKALEGLLNCVINVGSANQIPSTPGFNTESSNITVCLTKAMTDYATCLAMKSYSYEDKIPKDYSNEQKHDEDNTEE